MSTLEAEKDIKKKVQATEAVRLMDCGRVSENTQGLPYLLLFEVGIPPANTVLLL